LKPDFYRGRALLCGFPKAEIGQILCQPDCHIDGIKSNDLEVLAHINRQLKCHAEARVTSQAMVREARVNSHPAIQKQRGVITCKSSHADWL
jgi:hypothetical protein